MKKNLIITTFISIIMLLGDLIAKKTPSIEIILVRFLIIMAFWNAFDFIKARRDTKYDKQEKPKDKKQHSIHNKHTNRKKK